MYHGWTIEYPPTIASECLVFFIKNIKCGVCGKNENKEYKKKYNYYYLLSRILFKKFKSAKYKHEI